MEALIIEDQHRRTFVGGNPDKELGEFLPGWLLGFIPLKHVPVDRLNESGVGEYPKWSFATPSARSWYSAEVAVSIV